MNAAIRSRTEFLHAANEALDERRDPLADAGVRTWALEHPADAAQLLELQSSLGALASVTLPLRSPRRAHPARRVAAAAGLLLAVGGLAFLFFETTSPSKPALTAAQELELHPVVPAPALGCVWSWEQLDVSETSMGKHTVRASEGHVVFEDELRTPVVQLGSALARAEIVATYHESWVPR